MRTIAIIQARTGSSRLPRKVLLDLEGEPMLVRVVQRTQLASRVTQVLIATTNIPADDAIEELCTRRQYPCFRGSEWDVLDRYYQAARAAKADVVLRITSDCPLIEPEIVDRVVGEFQENQPLDYAANVCEPRTYPRGLDVEVFSFALLERLWHIDTNPAWREHVTEYVFQRPEEFRLRAVRHEQDYSHLRWTVDTPEDLELARRIYRSFPNHLFSWRDVLHLLDQHPEWGLLNQHVRQRTV